MFFICVMVPIFSFGERWNVLLNFALPRWKEHPIVHLMKISVSLSLFVFVKVSMSLLNIWGHIMTVPACSSGTLTNVLPHRNVMPQTQDMTPHPIKVYRHRADRTCYPLSIDVKRHFGQWGKLSAPVYNRIKAVHLIENSYIKNHTML